MYVLAHGFFSSNNACIAMLCISHDLTGKFHMLYVETQCGMNIWPFKQLPTFHMFYPKAFHTSTGLVKALISVAVPMLKFNLQLDLPS